MYFVIHLGVGINLEIMVRLVFSIILGNIPKIQVLVISCHIAQKHYEQTLIYWVSQKLKQNRYQELCARLIKTKRNTPLRIMFQS